MSVSDAPEKILRLAASAVESVAVAYVARDNQKKPPIARKL